MPSTKPVKRDFPLTNQGIDELVEALASYLGTQRADKAECLRIRLSVEELLLDWQAFLGTDAVVTLDCRRRMLRPSARVSVKGPRFRRVADEDFDFLDKLLVDLSLAPQTRYTAGVNVTTFFLPRRPVGIGIRVLAAALLGFAFGLAAKAFLPAQTCAGIATDIFLPVFSTLIGVISMLAAPLIFLSIFCGVCGSASMETFRRIGKYALSDGLAWAAVALALCLAVCIPLFGMGVSQAGASAEGAGDVFTLVLGILPNNLVDPFLQGNTLQIIVLAVAFGVAALRLGDGAARLVAVAEEIKRVVGLLIGWAVALLPLLVFLTVARNVMEDTVSTLVGCWLPFVAMLVAGTVLVVARVVVAARRMRRPVAEVVRAIAPVTLVSFATASSAAVFGEMLKTCRERLGVPAEMADVCVPLGIILSRFSSVPELVMGASYFAVQYGVETSVAWFVIFAVTTYLMAFALAPIPGGALAVISALYLQLGLPVEAIAVAMVIDVVFDFFATAGSVATALVQTGEIAVRCADPQAATSAPESAR